MNNTHHEKIHSTITAMVNASTPITFDKLASETGFELIVIEQYFVDIKQHFLNNIFDASKKQSFCNLYDTLVTSLSTGANPGYRNIAKHSGENKNLVKKYLSDVKKALGVPLVDSPFAATTSVTLEEKSMLLDELYPEYDNDAFIHRFNLFMSTSQAQSMFALSRFMNLTIFEVRNKMKDLNLDAEFYSDESVCDLPEPSKYPLNNTPGKTNYHRSFQAGRIKPCGNFLNLLSLFFSFSAFIIAIAIYNKIS